MMEFQYKRAPITEAVVEFRSSIPVNEKKRQKALKHLSKLYSTHNPLPHQKFEIQTNIGREPKITKWSDFILDRFYSDDMTQRLFITDITFLVSQLAPYAGWEQFKQRIIRDWETWRKVVGFQPTEQVGMRYVNRIDLPITESIVHNKDYVTVYPASPDLLNLCSHYSVNVRTKLEDIQSELNLKSAMVESPLPDNLSIVIDLDIVRMYQTPPNEEELFSFLDQARVKKNEIFEACITDKARGLFSQ